jgi:hypothetical protein
MNSTPSDNPTDFDIAWAALAPNVRVLLDHILRADRQGGARKDGARIAHQHGERNGAISLERNPTRITA